MCWLYVMLAASASFCSVKWFEIPITTFWLPHITPTRGLFASEVSSSFPGRPPSALCDSEFHHGYASSPIAPDYALAGVESKHAWAYPLAWNGSRSLAAVRSTRPRVFSVGFFHVFGNSRTCVIILHCTSHRIRPLEPRYTAAAYAFFLLGAVGSFPFFC